MPNANKAKGTRFESAVRDFINSVGVNRATRVAQAGEDVGDVHVNGMFALQCKDVTASNYSKWIVDAKEQARAAKVPFSAVVHKRRQRKVGEAYVVMDLDTFTDIAARLEIARMMRGKEE
jgi:hypothetical protein